MNAASDIGPAAEGFDFDWVLTLGAEAIWHYAFQGQSCLADMDAAFAAGDWPVCVAAGKLSLQKIVECEERGRGMTASAPETELHLRIATASTAAARALRAMPQEVGATQEDASLTVAAVKEHDAMFRAGLPLEVPLLRSARGSAQSMRLSASIIKWRAARGLGTPDWGHSAPGQAAAR